MASRRQQREMHELARQIFRDAMKGDWAAVEKTYGTNPAAAAAVITSSKDTALHLAVSDGQTDVVRRLAEAVDAGALRQKNAQGNTPLHLAAAQGSVEMCDSLVRRDPGLVGVRNVEGETALFVAALGGRRDAFAALQLKMEEDLPMFFLRRDDGDTVLHVAILGEYFELAFYIINLYPSLVNYNNEKGESPLHILAKNPFSFKSGHRFGKLEHIIYFCSWVEPLKVTPYTHHLNQQYLERKSRSSVPPNFVTCWNFFRLLWKAANIVLLSLFTAKCRERSSKADTENPKTNNQEINHRSQKEEESTKNKQDKNKTFVNRHIFPPNYVTFFHFLEVVLEILLVFFGVGFWKIAKIKEKKQKHVWAVKLMEELVKGASQWEYNEDGRKPLWESMLDSANPDDMPQIEGLEQPPPSAPSQGMKEMMFETEGNQAKIETPILVAAKTGITEVVEKILDVFPVAIQDVNEQGKNIVLLAVESRQPYVYKLVKKKCKKESVFQKVDKDGNSALHLAAALGDKRPWIISGAALQMQWEIKWYKLVKESMPRHVFARVNNKGETAREIFNKTHRSLVKEGGKWLTKTSESCSVVSALIATVAFASATSLPGGTIQDEGRPVFEGEAAFDVFTIASLVALCFSVTSLFIFLSIITSRQVAKDFEWSLPKKMVLGLSFLFVSIVATMGAFCAGHFFVLKDNFHSVALPIYAVTCFPGLLFAGAQLPLYADLLRSILTHVPQRTYRETPF